MPQPPIGIDLGTTYSAVASLDDKGTVYLLPNSEGLSLTPSVVFFENAGNIVVGQVAKDARADNPTDVIEFVKRSMGTDRKYRFWEQEFTPIDISAIILRKLKQDAEAALGGYPITQAVVTCPAYFGAEARDATEKAARIAGLELLALINEPTVAAMAFGMGGERKGTALVFDLGGGTFDVTLLRFRDDNSIDILAVDGNHELGGKDFDDALMSLAIKHFLSEHNYDIYRDIEALGELRQKVEKAKHDLTAHESTSINISAGGHKTNFELTRKQFADAIAHHIGNMRMTVMSVLDEKELRPQDVDEILMVGGSSRVPAVFDMVASLFGKQPNTSIPPDEAVARGAALFASYIVQQSATVTSRRRIDFDIDFDVTNAVGNAIGPNATVTAEVIASYYPVDEGQFSRVLFSAYYPHDAKVEERNSLFVYSYAHDYALFVEQDIMKFRDELGGQIPAPKSAKQSVQIPFGTEISVVPECDEIEFEPKRLTKKWHGDWTRFEFEFRPTQNLLHETLFVRISIQIAGIEVAHIKCATEVVGLKTETVLNVPISNPLATAKMKSQVVTPYQRIFISYSRRDSSVAKSYKIAQTALGNDAFLDVDNLRAGEDWRAALARAIDEADIFQLFWSEHSASSEYCRYEWDYALKVRCPDDTCEGFIRPVYWREPMPSPPSELSRINFRFVPFEDQDD